MPEKRKRIGELLIENNLITNEALDKAISYQEKYGGIITQYLLAKGFINSNDLGRCLSAQFGFPYLSISDCNITEDLLKLIPAEMIEKYLFLPVDKYDRSISMVMFDPTNERAVREVENYTGLEGKRYVGNISELIEAIEVNYNISVNVGGYIAKKKKEEARISVLSGRLTGIKDASNNLNQKLSSMRSWLDEMIENAEALNSRIKGIRK